MKNKKLYISVGSISVITFLIWILCLNHTSLNQIGVAYNSQNGSVNIQTNAGWYVTSPFVKVAYISQIPQRVHLLTSANITGTKMVMINPQKIHEYIAHQGFGYLMGNESVLTGYAFSGQTWDFLLIVE